MTRTVPIRRRLPLAVLAAVIAAASASVLLTADRGAAQGPAKCANADKTVEEAGVAKLRRSLFCLLNAERAERKRKAVRSHGALTRLARKHTKVMVRTKCFRHECRGERKLKKRVERSNYVRGGDRYGYGEILGCSDTPANIVDRWMERRYDRKNILDRRFRHVGVGAKRGTPFRKQSRKCKPGKKRVTYTVLFAWRKR